MFEYSWLYEFILVIYACSVLFYFTDFLQPNRKANRLAFWLLSVVWGMQTFYFIFESIRLKELPLFTQSNTLLFYAWLLISLSLLINWFFRMDFVLFFTNVIGFSVMAFGLFVAGNEMPKTTSAQLSTEWLMIHITMAFLSYAAFTLSFIFSGLYILQHYLLKKKKWSKHFRRWPSLIQLDAYAYRLNLLAVPLLLLSLILGIVWAYYTLDQPFWYDTKVIFSLFALVMYGIYLYQRVVKGWLGKRIVELNIICFLVLLTNYFISSLFSTFHIWI